MLSNDIPLTTTGSNFGQHCIGISSNDLQQMKSRGRRVAVVRTIIGRHYVQVGNARMSTSVLFPGSAVTGEAIPKPRAGYADPVAGKRCRGRLVAMFRISG